MARNTRFYKLKEPDFPWGDYGHILLSGMGTRKGANDDGPLYLTRTGPFLPPIFFPYFAVVVTDTFRRVLESSRLTGISFREVIIEKIVKLQWENWGRNSAEPKRYPAGGEPENYLRGKHQKELAAAMGTLWEICAGLHAKATMVPKLKLDKSKIEDRLFKNEPCIKESSWDGTDFFMARDFRMLFVSEKAKNWFESNSSEWVGFLEVRAG